MRDSSATSAAINRGPHLQRVSKSAVRHPSMLASSRDLAGNISTVARQSQFAYTRGLRCSPTNGSVQAIKSNTPRHAMRQVSAALLLFAIAVATPLIAYAQSTSAAPDKPFAIEYYYKTKWGHADEFLKLFKKNHYPVLKKEAEMGRITKVWMDQPRYHTTEDGRWDFRVPSSSRMPPSPTSPLTKPRCKTDVSRPGHFSARRTAPFRNPGCPLGLACKNRRPRFSTLKPFDHRGR